MKIAIFSDTFLPRMNGVANVVYLFAKSLAEAGHEVFIFTISKYSRKFLNNLNNTGKNLTIITLPSIPTPVYSGERLTLPIGMTLPFLKKIKPDIIHVHTPFALGLEAILAAKILKIPLIGTHHTFYDYYLKHVKLDYGWAKKLSWKYTVACYNRCDLILNPSQSLTDAMITEGLKKPAGVLRNFIETDFFRPPANKKTKLQLKNKFGIKEKSITYMGRLSYEKNIDQVVKAFALVLKTQPDLKLMIIGDGPERKNLEKLAQKLGIGNSVIFTGFLQNENLLSALQANDIFVTASKSENMPLSVVEAMAVGLPCVVAKEKGLAELIKDGYNGFLVETDESEKFAEKILKLLIQPKLLEKFGRASRELALEYSKEKITQKLIDIYNKTKKSMKICLYLDFYHFLGGILYKNVGTGLLSSYNNQKRSLKALDIEFTEKWDNSCDILQINTPWLKSLWLIKKAKRLGKKVIIWSHVTAEDIRGVFWFGNMITPLMKKYLTYAYGLADLVFCPSEYTKSLLVAYGLPSKKLVVQSNGVDLKLFFKDEQKRMDYRRQYYCDGLVIGTVGLVIPRKGVDIFLELAESYPQHQFIWFGKIYGKLMAKPLPKNLPSNVKFTGYVDDINAAFNAIDIFIFPSYEENQGMVILEAAAVGLPILVRDIPVYNGWLKDGENCLKAKNNDEFKNCLDHLINDQDLKNKLSKTVKILAQKESIGFLNKKLFSTYQRLLGQK